MILIVDWRAEDVGGTTTATQNVRVTIDDTVAPVITAPLRTQWST